jgi:putative membrane protein
MMITRFLKSTSMVAFFSGCTQHPMNYAPRGWGHMMEYGSYGGMFMWLILILIAGVVVYFAFIQKKNNGIQSGSPQESPLEILKRRYARGEISKDEFESIKKDLG